MKKIIASLLICTALTGCLVKKTTRIPSNLYVVEFNGVNSQFMRRPTFLSFQELHQGKEAIRIDMDAYGSNDVWISFGKEHIDSYKSHIKKYKDWHGIATKREDIINKLIGEAPDGTGNYNLKFSLYSGNENNHYLHILASTKGMFDSPTKPFEIYLDYNNVGELDKLLDNLNRNGFKSVDPDSIYN